VGVESLLIRPRNLSEAIIIALPELDPLTTLLVIWLGTPFSRKSLIKLVNDVYVVYAGVVCLVSVFIFLLSV